VPIHRAEAFVRTLHPNIAGRSFIWRDGQQVVVVERSYADLNTPEFLASPMAEVCRTGEYTRRDLHGEVDASLQPLVAAGYRDVVVAPLKFLTGQSHVATFASRDGFTDEHLSAIQLLIPPLARLGEIFALLRTATNLLSTYVGRNAGSRILGGQIQLGDTDTLRAVIWFSDLRGFTSLTQRVAPAHVIRALNELFECQIPAIEAHGGEVLKFIGDGLLAIFPFDAATGPTAERCKAALDAVTESLANLEARNAARAATGDDAIHFGVALHYGEVSYGNIGGANRLDFTCIGPAVNLAARLETLTGALGREVVLSEAFADLVGVPTQALGSFALKGVDGTVPAYAPLLGTGADPADPAIIG
jgi:adenylate cyclase